MSNKARRTSFKPGQCGNPNGRPKLPPEVREIKLHTKADIIQAYYKISMMPEKEAKEYIAATVLEAGILKCFDDFVRTGRTDQVKHLWAECHGKPSESVSVDIHSGLSDILNDLGEIK
jgi:hypothetical protein